MKIIGITGGVGSGKSEILNILKNDYQAKVIQSDHVAHELMVPGAKSYDAIVQAFGNEILNEDQTINRPILGEIVFHDETKLSLLNSITHKNVDEEILSRIDQFEKEEEFKSMASNIIDNSGDLEDTKAQIIKILG